MTDQEHTPEPWYAATQNDALYVVAGERPALDNDNPRHDAKRTAVAKVYEQVDCERIVACVNAMQGIRNPSDLRELVEAARAVVNEWECSPSGEVGVNSVERLEYAIAALDAEESSDAQSS